MCGGGVVVLIVVVLVFRHHLHGIFVIDSILEADQLVQQLPTTVINVFIQHLTAVSALAVPIIRTKYDFKTTIK